MKLFLSFLVWFFILAAFGILTALGGMLIPGGDPIVRAFTFFFFGMIQGAIAFVIALKVYMELK